VISSSQRPLPDNTQHSQQTNIRAPGGIQNHDLSRRAAADLRLRTHGHWDRRLAYWSDEYNKWGVKHITTEIIFWEEFNCNPTTFGMRDKLHVNSLHHTGISSYQI